MKAIVTTEEFGKLSKELQGEYAEAKDGKHVLKVESVDGLVLENTTELRSALGQERQTVKELQKLQASFKDLDPEAARAALTKVEEMKNWKPEDKVREQIAAREKDLTEKHAREMKEKDDDNKSLSSQLEELLVTNEARNAILSFTVDGKAPNVELLLPHVTRQIKTTRGADKKYTAQVVDEKGNQRITQTAGSTAPMSIVELVGTMRSNKTFEAAFPGFQAAGAGSENGGGGGGGRGKIDPNLPAAERMRIARQQKGAA